MPKKGYKMSSESKLKMSLAKLGKPSWNTGKKMKSDWAWNKGVKIDKEKYPKMGHHEKHSEEAKKRMSEKAVGRKYSKERNRKISEAMKTRVVSEATRKKLSEGRFGRNNPAWKEEKADRTYAVDWTKTLKRSIRERDKYTCRICMEQQKDRAHAVHHIDYNKYNCSPDNLITLCHSCHAKTNHKRDSWIIYFENIQL